MPTPAAVKAEETLIHVLWINAGLSCDGDSVALTAATQPSIEEIALGALPGLPQIAVHWPLIDFECGPAGGADDFLEWFFKQKDSAEARLAKARTRDSLQAIGKLTSFVDGNRQIRSDPPLIMRLDDMKGLDPELMRARLGTLMQTYRRIRADASLDRYRMLLV